MAVPPPPSSPHKLLWANVYQQLLRHALPDSRFNLDFLNATPNFRGSPDAITRITNLPCYKTAHTLLVTSDNSLEGLRHRALQDGKKVLVGTYRLRRGFVLLDPSVLGEARFELAACLDGMERPGMGRAVSLGQLRDEGWKIDMCALGGLVFNEQGVVVWEGAALFEVQWAVLRDLGVLQRETCVVGVAHDCQVVDEALFGVEAVTPDKSGEVQCDFVVTPTRVLEVADAVRPSGGVDFDKVDPDALHNIPPLQELKGIRMMEQIMSSSGFGVKEEKQYERKTPSADEQMGIDIVERLMKGLKG